MQILAIDVGAGAQDVLLFDTAHEPENASKQVMPSPTARLARASVLPWTAAAFDGRLGLG